MAPNDKAQGSDASGAPLQHWVRRLREEHQPMKEIRVEWSINGMSGGGLWFTDSEANRVFLESYISLGNEKYSPGSHWITERSA